MIQFKIEKKQSTITLHNGDVIVIEDNGGFKKHTYMVVSYLDSIDKNKCALIDLEKGSAVSNARNITRNTTKTKLINILYPYDFKYTFVRYVSIIPKEEYILELTQTELRWNK